ncbi:hypothetical protein B0H63DRAFT_501695 [Podospora didyma]|uniref:ABC transporter domain-containing protein n=1 Tax=Podospora didyma TaxID=330526 RepID=A0AAE0U083_9PEZI|nr:hypothetical protein B0H63DRAFT_501695 [Podospora didyma]
MSHDTTESWQLPQDPFLPQDEPLLPSFLDTEACLCQLQGRPDDNRKSGTRNMAWRCFGNQNEGYEKPLSGKWFLTTDGANSTSADILRIPINSAAHPPAIDKALQYDNKTRSLVPITSSQLSVWDQACTALNNTAFSTTFYQAAAESKRGDAPISAAPCWRAGAIPLQIQSVTDWQTNGCIEGFLCPNNTVNSLPQFCPPIEQCQMARLAGVVCSWDSVNLPMGVFEPIVCQGGHYCPVEDKGKKTYICPAGTYCQMGASTPTPCSVGSKCPEGSTYQLFIAPIGVLIALDVLLIIGMLLLRHRKKRKSDALGHQEPLLKTSKLMVNGIKSAFKGHAYNKVPKNQEKESENADLEQEITLMNATYIPRQQETWNGFQAALDIPVNALMSPVENRHNLEAGMTAEIRAFVESMRKATDTSDIGLSFGYFDLAFQPKGSARPILQNVTGEIRRGALTAVMGGSGAGKSTFVNVLMGKTPYTSGRVLINGSPGKLRRYKKVVGYVPQDDIVLPELTVWENLLHSARIRLPRTWKDAEIRAHVTAVIDCLELSHVRDSLVGSVSKPVLSGGQRKRVSIGMELAAAPMAIFLDEPTSGLDATAASSIMKTLKAVARLGISVIVIIHQPRMEIFEMIDDLILLANGQMIYEGPETEIQPFFERLGFHFPPHANFGDVVTDIITGNGRGYKKIGDISKDALISHWAASRQAQRSNTNTNDDNTPTQTRSHTPSHSRSASASSTSSDTAAILAVTPDFPPAEFTTAANNNDNNNNPYLMPPNTQNRRTSVTSLLSNPTATNTAMHRVLKTRGAPGWRQFQLCFSRAILQQYRALSIFWFEMGLATLAGFLLGLAEHAKKGVLFTGNYHQPYAILSVSSDFRSAPEMALLVCIAIGLVGAAPGVRVFSEELMVHRREAEAGHSRFAYFAAKSAAVVPRMAAACLHFTTPLLLLSATIVPWGVAFLANMLYFYCIYGLASGISMVVKREDAPLFATMISLIVGILSGAAPPLSTVRRWHMEWLWRASPGTWLAEIYFGQLVSPFRYLYNVDQAAEMSGYALDHLWRNMLVLIAIGTVYRVLAFCGLFVGKRMRM